MQAAGEAPAESADRQVSTSTDGGGGSGGGGLGSDTRGKHRIMVELKRLEQEARSLEAELGELERIEKVSSVCPELTCNIESRPDPLLPQTIGPENPSWDRWFEGPKQSQGCRCWIL